jgi:enoyl-CoA hydratase
VNTVTTSTTTVDTLAGITSISINRPTNLNALNSQATLELSAAIDAANGNPETRVIIISGVGGFDLSEQMEQRPTGIEAWRAILDQDFGLFSRIWSSQKPTIAAVAGPCLGGGFELALACDMTIAAHEAVFGEPELKFGAGIVAMLLPWIIGSKAAREIILTGVDNISAKRAYELGIVNRVVARDDLFREATRIARTMAEIDPMVMRQTKRALNRTRDCMGFSVALADALDIDIQIEGQGSKDKQRFFEVARSNGLRAAFDWRAQRFS